MKIPILGTGLSGLVGTRIVELLQDTYDFEDMSFDTGIDITHYDQVENKVKESESKIILHMAAKTDVDGCEDDRILLEEGKAWIINVVGTQNIIDAAKKYNKQIIYISTDFVFDGTKEWYTEDDEPNPINWYAITKQEAEEAVIHSGVNYIIARLSYPYRAKCNIRPDFVRRIIEKIQKKEIIYALTDHVFTPTFIDDIAQALDILIQKKVQGIYHIVGSQSLTPCEAVEKIQQTFHIQGSIQKVKREQYFKGKAFRPFHLALKNDKMAGLGFKMHTFDEGLRIMKQQMEEK
jgi:dTDP-4-dehydrorhamnose reductase